VDAFRFGSSISAQMNPRARRLMLFGDLAMDRKPTLHRYFARQTNPISSSRFLPGDRIPSSNARQYLYWNSVVQQCRCSVPLLQQFENYFHAPH
jgi:hypothetical protein